MDRFCINCGKKINQEAEFCKYCGTAQSAKAAAVRPERRLTTAASDINDKKTEKGISIIGIAIIALVALGIVAASVMGVVWIRQKNDGNTQNGKEATEQTQEEYEEVDKSGEKQSTDEDAEENVVKESLKDRIPNDAVEFNGNYYLVYNEGCYWKDAKKRCEELEGHLATVTGQEEQDFIIGLIESQGNKRNYWLGATDAEQEGNWKWITGESWDYTHWKDNQPDNRNVEDEDGDQNYLQVCATSKDDTERYGLWYDVANSGISHGFEGAPYYKNTEDTGYVCEWELRDDN